MRPLHLNIVDHRLHNCDLLSEDVRDAIELIKNVLNYLQAESLLGDVCHGAHFRVDQVLNFGD